MKHNFKLLDTILETRIREKHLPGVAVSIRGPEGIVFEKGYGYRDKEKHPVDEHTIMGIASMSKSSVTLALALLANERKCSFDDPVITYFPDFRIPGTPKEAVTLRSLAMHTAGIPPMEPLEWSIALNTPGRDTLLAREMRKTAPDQMNTIEQIIAYIAHCPYPTLGAPGEYMSYSNEGYAVLSYIVDKVAGYPLEQFLEDRVFSPLGMKRTVLDKDCSAAKILASDGNITSLWERDSNGTFIVDNSWSILPPFRGCACVKSTAHDMARYYQCLSNRGMLDGIQSIPEAVCEMMTGLSFPLSDSPVYCYGLYKRLWQGHTICEHSGGLHGVSSHGGFLLNENCSFTVLCNEGDQDAENLCQVMYNIYTGHSPDESHEWLHPRQSEFSEPHILAGTYICHEGEPVVLTVLTDIDRLIVRKADTEYNALFCGSTDFLCRTEKNEYALRLHFYVRNGSAWGCRISSRIYTRIE